MSEENKDWLDTELIECAKCGKPLNGNSLWVVGGKEAETWCEECYAVLRDVKH